MSIFTFLLFLILLHTRPFEKMVLDKDHACFDTVHESGVPVMKDLLGCFKFTFSVKMFREHLPGIIYFKSAVSLLC